MERNLVCRSGDAGVWRYRQAQGSRAHLVTTPGYNISLKVFSFRTCQFFLDISIIGFYALSYTAKPQQHKFNAWWATEETTPRRYRCAVKTELLCAFYEVRSCLLRFYLNMCLWTCFGSLTLHTVMLKIILFAEIRFFFLHSFFHCNLNTTDISLQCEQSFELQNWCIYTANASEEQRWHNYDYFH